MYVCEHASLHMLCIMHLSVCGVHAGMSMSGYVADLANFRAPCFDNCCFTVVLIVYLACDHLRLTAHSSSHTLTKCHVTNILGSRGS